MTTKPVEERVREIICDNLGVRPDEVTMEAKFIEDQLAEMAKKLARRVAKEGKVITFDPMTARDRRVVHMALKDMTDVRTESHGEGPDRRVQIIPVKN